MSTRASTLAHKTKQIPRIFRRERGCSTSRRGADSCDSTALRLSTENVLANVRVASDDQLHYENAVMALYHQQETCIPQNQKVLQQQISGHKTKTVEDIEKWLRNTSEPISSGGINMKSNSQAITERYLNEQLPEAFIEKELLITDIDLATKKLNMGYDNIFNELQNDKFLPASEKDNVFILPDLDLDNLEQLACCPEDINSNGEILPLISDQPPCNNVNVNTKDLIIRLQETINRFSNNDKIIENVQTQNGVEEVIENHRLNNDVINIENYINGNFYDTSLPVSIQNLPIENVSCESDVDDPNYDINLEKEEACNNIIEFEGLTLDPSFQTKPKNSHVKNKSTNSPSVNCINLKSKFQPSIIKRKRKLIDKESTYCSDKDSIISVVADSTDKQSKVSQIITNTSETDAILKNKSERSIRLRNESTASDSHESEEDFRGKPLSYYNQQELAISNALEKVGITDHILQYLTVDNYKVWQCHQDECGRQFAKLCALKAHLLTHFGLKPFKCDYDGCSWAFYSDFKLKRHKETHLKRKDYICSMPGCKRRFTTVYNLASHEKLHTRPNRIICQVPECTAKFQTKRALEEHMKTHDGSLAPYVCNFEGCSKRYYGSNALMSHQRCHSYTQLDVTCSWPGCGKTFDQPCRLKTHMRSHTGLKPYACTFKGCKWAFSTNSKLKRHQKKHTNDRKFVCDEGDCKKAFMRSEHLKEHKLTHAKERFFQCHLCTSAFSAKSSLYVHIKKHSNKDFVSRAPRQTKKKKTVEKKTINKKKEAFCSRIQPIRISVSKLKIISISNDCSDIEEETINQKINKTVEKDENTTVKVPSILTPTVEDKASNNTYYCSVNSCTTSHPTKASLKMHLQKERTPPLSEIQNNNVTHEVSSSPFSQDLIIYSASQCSINQPADQMIMPYEAVFLNERTTGSMNQESTILQTADSRVHLEIQDAQPDSVRAKTVEEPVMRNHGSARTAFTCEDVIRLKPNGRVMDSSVGASDVVLGAANFGDSLLLSDDLPSMYCQEDIGVPGYQILLLDTGPTDSEISIRDLD